jgi:hypothetical protein
MTLGLVYVFIRDEISYVKCQREKALSTQMKKETRKETLINPRNTGFSEFRIAYTHFLKHGDKRNPSLLLGWNKVVVKIANECFESNKA